MITENQEVFIGEADDTNEFGVRIQTRSLDFHVTPETAIAFAEEIIDAAKRAMENDQEEARARALEAGGLLACDVDSPRLFAVDNPTVVAINRKSFAPDGGDAA